MTSPPSPPAPARDVSLDVAKGLLVLTMIAGHTVQLLAKNPRTHVIEAYANLVCFPGFLLCFGAAHRLAYGHRSDGEARRRLLKGANRTFAAFVLSALAVAFILYPLADKRLLLDYLSLRQLPRLSEFLLAFVLVALLAALAWPWLRRGIDRPWVLVAVGAVGALTTLIPVPERLPLAAGLFIGHPREITFPVLPYVPYYLLGWWLGGTRRPLSAWWLAGLIATLPAASIVFRDHDLPSRFPPSGAWVAGGLLPVLVYRWLGHSLPELLARPLAQVGENALPYLVMSNVALFGIHMTNGPSFADGRLLLVYATVVGLCAFVVGQAAPPRRD